jgi:hypothetical protein
LGVLFLACATIVRLRELGSVPLDVRANNVTLRSRKVNLAGIPCRKRTMKQSGGTMEIESSDVVVLRGGTRELFDIHNEIRNELIGGLRAVSTNVVAER